MSKRISKKSFIDLRQFVILIFVSCFSLTVFATEKVYIFTTDRGTFSPIYMGSVYVQEPKRMNQDSVGISGMSRQEWENSVRFSSILKEVQEKGYEIIVRESPPPSDFFKAVEDPEAVLILHEGHGIRHEIHSEIVVLEVGGKPIAKDALDSYLASVGRSKIKASPRLKFIYTQACYGQLSENYYRPKLKLPKAIQWIGSDESVDPYNTPQMLDLLERQVLSGLTRVGSAHPIKITHGTND